MTTEKFSKPPPEKMLSNPKNWFWAKKLRKADGSTPGMGKWAPTRKTTSANNTNRMLLRKSGVVQICCSLRHIIKSNFKTQKSKVKIKLKEFYVLGCDFELCFLKSKLGKISTVPPAFATAARAPWLPAGALIVSLGNLQLPISL